jgi:hypothetical protein
MSKKFLALFLISLLIVPIYVAQAQKDVQPLQEDEAPLLRGRNYLVLFDEVARSWYLEYPRDGSNHMFWWEWALRYGGEDEEAETHWASEFDVIRHYSGRRVALWLLTNGDVRVRILVIAREPNRIDIRYYIMPLKRDLGNIKFYQGADFDIDDTLWDDDAFYERRVVYAVGEEGTFIGFRSLNKRPSEWYVGEWWMMWDAIEEGELNNAYFYSDDIGVALGFDIGRRGRIAIRLGFGSSLDELSRALGVRLTGLGD